MDNLHCFDQVRCKAVEPAAFLISLTLLPFSISGLTVRNRLLITPGAILFSQNRYGPNFKYLLSGVDCYCSDTIFPSSSSITFKV